MLSKEDNELLTQTNPGTPMGDLIRRYWVPALLSEEIPQRDGPPARVRLLRGGAGRLSRQPGPHRVAR